MTKKHEISKKSLKRRWGNTVLSLACIKCIALFVISLYKSVPGHDSATWAIGFEFFVGLLLLGMNMYQNLKEMTDGEK